MTHLFPWVYFVTPRNAELERYYVFHRFADGSERKPLVTLFSPYKGTPAMAANRLARWALLIHQYDYTVEYCRSKDHGNADALSRLPFSNDTNFDGEGMEEEFAPKIDTLVPSIPHLLQGRQSRQASKHSNAEDSEVVSKVEHHYTLGDPCYALYFGPRRHRDPRWVPATITKVHGARSVNVRVILRGPTWRRHLDQLRPRYGSDQDDDPCEIPTSFLSTETLPAGTDHASSSSSNQRKNPRLPTETSCASISVHQSVQSHQAITVNELKSILFQCGCFWMSIFCEF